MNDQGWPSFISATVTFLWCYSAPMSGPLREGFYDNIGRFLNIRKNAPKRGQGIETGSRWGREYQDYCSSLISYGHFISLMDRPMSITCFCDQRCLDWFRLYGTQGERISMLLFELDFRFWLVTCARFHFISHIVDLSLSSLLISYTEASKISQGVIYSLYDIILLEWRRMLTNFRVQKKGSWSRIGSSIFSIILQVSEVSSRSQIAGI